MLGLALLFTTIAAGLWIGGCLAADKIVFHHSLSTTRATGFSEQGFTRIRAGMTTDEVRAILGQPLKISRIQDHGQEWWYTAPKEPIDGWGTWDGRYLIVSNGVVGRVHRQAMLNH